MLTCRIRTHLAEETPFCTSKAMAIAFDAVVNRGLLRRNNKPLLHQIVVIGSVPYAIFLLQYLLVVSVHGFKNVTPAHDAQEFPIRHHGKVSITVADKDRGQGK